MLVPMFAPGNRSDRSGGRRRRRGINTVVVVVAVVAIPF